MSSRRPEYPTAESVGISPANVIEYGNINLALRPIVKLKNGSIATIFSITITRTILTEQRSSIVGGTKVQILIPSISDDGEILKDKDATELYLMTGRHLGIFATIKDASKYGKALSAQESAKYKTQIKNNPDYLVGEKTWYPIDQVEDTNKRNLGAILQLADLYGGAEKTFSDNLVSVTVSYSMDLDNEISFEVIDEDYEMLNNNYFVIRRDLIYRGRRYEIADISCQPGPGGAPSVVVKARNKAIQQMRRDKRPGSVTGGSGYEYAGNAAKKFGLQFVGQQTAKTKSTFKAKTSDGEESVYDVLKRLATDNQFVIFEVDGVLVYAQQEWLLWKFGSSSTQGTSPKKFVPLLFLPNQTSKELALSELTVPATELFDLETWHNFSSADNDPLGASGSCNVLMPQGGALRPGHTAVCGPFPVYFAGGYLITEVSFSEGSPTPASITFRTPEEPKDQKGKPLKEKVGTKPGAFNYGTSNTKASSTTPVVPTTNGLVYAV